MMYEHVTRLNCLSQSPVYQQQKAFLRKEFRMIEIMLQLKFLF